MWTLYYTKQAQKDARKLASCGLKAKAQQLLMILQSDPWQTPPLFLGPCAPRLCVAEHSARPLRHVRGYRDLLGARSARPSLQHRRTAIMKVQDSPRPTPLRMWKCSGQQVTQNQ